MSLSSSPLGTVRAGRTQGASGRRGGLAGRPAEAGAGGPGLTWAELEMDHTETSPSFVATASKSGSAWESATADTVASKLLRTVTRTRGECLKTYTASVDE